MTPADTCPHVPAQNRAAHTHRAQTQAHSRRTHVRARTRTCAIGRVAVLYTCTRTCTISRMPTSCGLGRAAGWAGCMRQALVRLPAGITHARVPVRCGRAGRGRTGGPATSRWQAMPCRIRGAPPCRSCRAGHPLFPVPSAARADCCRTGPIRRTGPVMSGLRSCIERLVEPPACWSSPTDQPGGPTDQPCPVPHAPSAECSRS